MKNLSLLSRDDGKQSRVLAVITATCPIGVVLRDLDSRVVYSNDRERKLLASPTATVVWSRQILIASPFGFFWFLRLMFEVQQGNPSSIDFQHPGGE